MKEAKLFDFVNKDVFISFIVGADSSQNTDALLQNETIY